MRDPSSFLWGVELISTRGHMSTRQALTARRLATQLVDMGRVDWVSITDNAGGNPMLSPEALGKPILYAGKDVIIHLSCKDFNRNGLESAAWLLASEGFDNLLALTGDYPARAYRGRGKPVFDIDSVGLISMLSAINDSHETRFFVGAVTTNFKLRENEVVPQYLKLEKKIQAGAGFIITQIGFDARKSHELACYLQLRGYREIPLIGNVFLLSGHAVRFFRSGRIPGVVVSDELLQLCERQEESPDRGKAFFLELAAKQVAIFRGLKYRGVYLGGLKNTAELERIIEIEASFSPRDWETFAPEMGFSRPGEFYYFERDPGSGLADVTRPNPSLGRRERTRNMTLGYRLNKWVHDRLFDREGRAFRWGRKLYQSSSDPLQGPPVLRRIELLGKSLLFGCQDCGDCSLPDTGFLCPESACAKNQRNGPCGGTRDGKCEVDKFECIWCRTYDRLKSEGREGEMLAHAPAIQDQSLRGTSSWGNHFLGKDHRSRKEDGLTLIHLDSSGEAPGEVSTSGPSRREEADG